MFAEFGEAVVAIVFDLEGGVVADEGESFFQGWIGDFLAGFQVGFDLFEEPWVAEAATADEDAVCARDFHGFFREFDGCDVAVYEKGDMWDLAASFTYAIPIGFAAIALFLGAAMHGDEFGAGFREVFYKFETVGVVGPSQTGFDADGNGDRGFHGADDGFGAFWVADKGGAVEVMDDVVYWATHVDVEGVGLEFFVDDGGGAGHGFWVAAKDLLD